MTAIFSRLTAQSTQATAFPSFQIKKADFTAEEWSQIQDGILNLLAYFDDKKNPIYSRSYKADIIKQLNEALQVVLNSYKPIEYKGWKTLHSCMLKTQAYFAGLEKYEQNLIRASEKAKKVPTLDKINEMKQLAATLIQTVQKLDFSPLFSPARPPAP